MLELLEIRYLGGCKPQRGYDERMARGQDPNGDWSILIPESVLARYFSGIEVVSGATLYGVLGIRRDASQDDIRTAFRKLARQWHADVNTLYREESSNSEFIRIKESYDILSNPDARARYEAGLALEASLRNRQTDIPPTGYRAPQRCGYVLAEGDWEGSVFIVSEILEWQPITRDDGKRLNVRWDVSQKVSVESWV